jgi:hypothetical protein
MTPQNTLTTLGVTVNRWGGNAVTAYNPNGQFTNAGNDWYFENRVASPPDADAWVGWNAAAGANTIVAIPSYVIWRALRGSVLTCVVQAGLGRERWHVVLLPEEHIPE